MNQTYRLYSGFRFFLFMTVFSVVLLVGGLCTPASFAATTKYIDSPNELPVRTGQGPEFRIMTTLQPGAKVQLLQESGTWAKVKMANGLTGWLPGRYLSATLPPPKEEGQAHLPEATLQPSPAPAKEEKTKSRQKSENQELQLLQQSLRQEPQEGQKPSHDELRNCLAERDQFRKDLEALKATAASTVAVKEQVAQLTAELQEARKKLVFQEERKNSSAGGVSGVWWFLAGAGVLACGIFFGLLIGKSRKRKGPMY